MKEEKRQMCSRCGKMKNESEFKNRSYCRECHNFYQRAYYRRFHDVTRVLEPIVIKNGKKKCSKCGKWLSTDKFSPNKQLKCGLHSRCKKCHCEDVTASFARRKI